MWGSSQIRNVDQAVAAFDEATLLFYAKEAEKYATQSAVSDGLFTFLERLTPSSTILELGCGGGRDTKLMLNRGFDVVPSDGSPELAAIAEHHAGIPVKVMRFDELTGDQCFDAVWANACLLHVLDEHLVEVLRLIWLSLRRDGLFFASYKLGEGPEYDALGRYYNFPSRDRLRTAYNDAGLWSTFEMNERLAGGYDGVERCWLSCTARKSDVIRD
jgi:SAM-dependent methyltransferase